MIPAPADRFGAVARPPLDATAAAALIARIPYDSPGAQQRHPGRADNARGRLSRGARDRLIRHPGARPNAEGDCAAPVIPARISPDLQPREAAPATEAAEMRQHLCGWVSAIIPGAWSLAFAHSRTKPHASPLAVHPWRRIGRYPYSFADQDGVAEGEVAIRDPVDQPGCCRGIRGRSSHRAEPISRSRYNTPWGPFVSPNWQA